MKYFDVDMTEETRNIRNDYIQKRWSQLQALSKESGEHAIKYLFTVNAGGAVATLAYLGSKTNSTIGIKVSLVLFFIGLIFVGILKAYTLHQHEALFSHYREQVTRYYNNQIEWDTLIKSDEEKVGNPLAPYVFGYIGFGCFIFGSIVGACTLM